ncbi:unnamed protein product [Calicophoron daubneyi]|uniref:MYG1 protein n=1 Tax=Calicophoron daubneyi TaxID=300641 RepID=A0AAV2TXV5_CALDB
MPAVNLVNPVIGTHDGRFHADELLACSMLRQLPEFRNARIVRTRDESQLSACSIVMDVGGIFDPSTNRYDHHQRGFNLTFKDFFEGSKWDIKLSSAGLIYVHFGQKVISGLVNKDIEDPMVCTLFHKIYSAFLSEIDAIDNGVSISDVPTRYSIHTGLSSRIDMLNPQWNQPDMDETSCFMTALEVVEKEFVSLVKHYANYWYPARHLVLVALIKRHEVDSSGHVVLLESWCPWQSHLHELERNELEASGRAVEYDPLNQSTVADRPLFCVYPRKEGTWSAQAIAVSGEDQFKNRIPFPEPWRGLRDEELSAVVGLPGCVFVHATGFLAVHKTRDGILHMVRATLKLSGLSD